MATSKTWNGSNYSIPASGERNWPSLSDFLSALADGAQTTGLQKVGMRVATSSPVTVSASSDCIVVVALSAPGAVTVNLPAGTTGQWFAIADGTGDAATNNITVTPASGQINGASTYVIGKNRAGIIIAYNGTSWTVVGEFTSESSTTGSITIKDANFTVQDEADPTKQFKFQASGITAGQTRTFTVPDASTTMVGTDTAQTLTNKTIDADQNTITNIENADIKSGAAIAHNKLADITAGSVLMGNGSNVPTATSLSGDVTVNSSGVTAIGAGKVTNAMLATATNANTAGAVVARDGSGNFSAGTITATLSGNATNVTGTVAIGNGGTGQTTATAGFDALSPATTKGDIIAHNGTDNIRLAVGTNGQVLMADSAQASGVKWSDGGGGAGELNVIANGSAASSTTGWSNGANHSNSRITSGSPLDPTVPTAIRATKSNASATTETSTSGVYYPFTLPVGLENRKLKVEFYCIVPATGVWMVSVYDGTTRLSLSTDSSGATTLPAGVIGKFTTTFDTTANNAYTVSFTETSGVAGNLDVTNVIVGPGIQPQGAVITPTRSYTPVWTASTGSPNIGATGSSVGTYYRVGETANFSIRATFSGAGASWGTTSLRFSLPSGVSFNSAAATASTPIVGMGYAYSDSGANRDYVTIGAYPVSSSIIGIFLTDSVNNSLGEIPEDFALVTTGQVEINFSIPVLEWAGSGTINLAQNDVEYAYNTSLTTATDTTSFGYGTDGVAVQAFAPAATASIQKRVRFQTPIQQTDVLTLQFKTTTGAWVNSNETTNYIGLYDGTTQRYVGAVLYPATSTDVDVYFYSGAFWQASDSTLRTWSETSSAYTHWRVVKTAAGQAVGFGLASSTSSGLVSPYSTNGVVYAGTYTATTSSLSNCSAITVRQHNYQRVGSIVTVTGRAEGTVTTTGTDVSFLIDLPVNPGSFADVYQASGTATMANSSANTEDPGYVNATASGSTVRLGFEGANIGSAGLFTAFYSFSYKIQ